VALRQPITDLLADDLELLGREAIGLRVRNVDGTGTRASSKKGRLSASPTA
jgi:hypothetical protein